MPPVMSPFAGVRPQLGHRERCSEPIPRAPPAVDSVRREWSPDTANCRGHDLTTRRVGETLDVKDEIEPLAREWDDLADRVSAPPFLRSGWTAAWWLAFGRGHLEV